MLKRVFMLLVAAVVSVTVAQAGARRRPRPRPRPRPKHKPKVKAKVRAKIDKDRIKDGPLPARNWKVWSPGVNRRQLNQHLRIARGIRSGSLTSAEAQRLVSMENHIRKMERAMKSDGVLTAAERKTLHKALNDASKAIFAIKHNGPHRLKLRPVIVAKIDSGELTGAEARELLAQLRRLSHISRLLSSADLSPEKRAALEAEYAQLASQLFE